MKEDLEKGRLGEKETWRKRDLVKRGLGDLGEGACEKERLGEDGKKRFGELKNIDSGKNKDS